MKFYNRTHNQKENETLEEKAKTTILEGIRLSGEIKGSHNLYIAGEFEGKIELTSLLLVGRTGRLKGEVQAKNVVIEGEVDGTVSVTGKLEVRDGGKYTGDVTAPAVLVSDKAFFQANVKMLRNGQESEEQHSREAESQPIIVEGNEIHANVN